MKKGATHGALRRQHFEGQAVRSFSWLAVSENAK